MAGKINLDSGSSVGSIRNNIFVQEPNTGKPEIDIDADGNITLRKNYIDSNTMSDIFDFLKK